MTLAPEAERGIVTTLQGDQLRQLYASLLRLQQTDNNQCYNY